MRSPFKACLLPGVTFKLYHSDIVMYTAIAELLTVLTERGRHVG